MPELPEVETTRLGIEPYIKGRRIKTVIIRQRQLRFPITRGLDKKISSGLVKDITRRGKYLLFNTDLGTLIIHLGMSGHLRVLKHPVMPGKHDHFDMIFDNNRILRFCDPRKFGAILWTAGNPLHHKLIMCLGPEPLTEIFNGHYLYTISRGRRTAIKNFIMNSRIVAGVGNIYANEALYMARIHPAIKAGRISAKRMEKLAATIQTVLKHAIEKGGTSLRDFVHEDGKPGYFKASLKVYNRAGNPCPRCGELIVSRVIGQRSSYYCPHCQH